MLLRLEAIKFNHDSSSSNVDAFNIRKNEKEFVEAPEWRRGVSLNPEDSPAAYALFETRGSTLTIQARFCCDDPQINNVEIRALDARIYPKVASDLNCVAPVVDLLRPLLFDSPGNVLGEVRAKKVRFSKGTTGYETFNLRNVRIWDAGVGVQNIVWRWQYRLFPNGSWTDFASSSHRIYSVLSKPREPWKQSRFESSNIQLPWTAVLEYACRWAAGAQNPTDAATRITHRVYQLGTDGIAQYCGRSQYTIPFVNVFKCAEFLFDLKLGRMKLNCADCATIVSTFANILGGELWQADMRGFIYNPVLLIGEREWHPGEFEYHTVAWEEDCDVHNDVFDACLQIDSDEDPTNVDSDHVALLPTNLRFGRPAEKLYRDRLVAPNNRINAAQPLPDRRTRLPIAASPLLENSSVSQELLDSSNLRFNLGEITTGLVAEDNRFVDFTLDENSLKGWTRLRSDRLKTNENGVLSESLWRSQDAADQLLLINIYEGASVQAGRKWLHHSIAALHSSEEVCKKEGTFADAYFLLGDDCGITFAISNLVVSLISVGACTLPVEQIGENLFQKFAISVPANGPLAKT